MYCYKDRSFCASPKCSGKCGRKITKDERAEAKEWGMPISFGNFCDVTENDNNKLSSDSSTSCDSSYSPDYSSSSDCSSSSSSNDSCSSGSYD